MHTSVPQKTCENVQMRHVHHSIDFLKLYIIYTYFPSIQSEKMALIYIDGIQDSANLVIFRVEGRDKSLSGRGPLRCWWCSFSWPGHWLNGCVHFEIMIELCTYDLFTFSSGTFYFHLYFRLLLMLYVHIIKAFSLCSLPPPLLRLPPLSFFSM